MLTGSGEIALSLRAEVLRLPFGDVKGSLLVYYPDTPPNSSLERYLFLSDFMSSSLLSPVYCYSLENSISEVLSFKEETLNLGLVICKLCLSAKLLLLGGMMLLSPSKWWLESLSKLVFFVSEIFMLSLLLNIESMLWLVIFRRVELI